MEKTETNTDLSSLNPIRVETALSRYPVHRLAKHGDIAININERNESGEISIMWEVNHNSKYGQPGPLAYKLDTLIINRRIEESARPIPRLIKLGSLRDICRELGISEGKNKESIKKSLFQNASSFITAKINYRQRDGLEKSLKAGFTRYDVVLTGEKLPDGRKADAVYIILSDVYLQVISGAMTRPLDYEYLKSLPPAPQRFYELLSYQIYAAIKNDRPRAKLLYSELCIYAPLVRQTDWNVVRPQLARLHALHKKSGYIGKIDCQDTVDSEGKPDWIMLYQPGPKAKAEYRAFTKRGGSVSLEVAPFAVDARPQILAESTEPSLLAQLVNRGVTKTKAAELAQKHPAEYIEAKIEIFDWRVEKKDKQIAMNPAGWLVKSIEDDYPSPKGFTSRADRARETEAKQAAILKANEERRREREKEAAEKAERVAINAYREALTPEKLKQYEAEALAQTSEETRKHYESTTQPSMRRLLLSSVLDGHIRTILQEQGKLPANS